MRKKNIFTFLLYISQIAHVKLALQTSRHFVIKVNRPGAVDTNSTTAGPPAKNAVLIYEARHRSIVVIVSSFSVTLAPLPYTLTYVTIAPPPHTLSHLLLSFRQDGIANAIKFR